MSELDTEKAKAFFASRTALWNIAGIVAAWFIAWRFPAFNKAMCEHKEITVTIGLLLFTLFCSVNLWLRKVTHCRIGRAFVWLGAMGLIGCSSLPQKLETDIYYRRDLPFCVEGFACYDGLTVLPRQSSYTFDIAPKGDADIDLLVVTTCHRNTSFEKTASGWFVFQKKNRFRYVYTPNDLIEGSGDCPLVFQTFEREKGRHSWAVILFEHPKYTLPATLYCDGETIRGQGVLGCQSKEGLRQGIAFEEKVMLEADKSCPVPTKGSGKFYEWPVGYKQCGYTFRGESGRLGTLFTSGYRGELVRETK